MNEKMPCSKCRKSNKLYEFLICSYFTACYIKCVVKKYLMVSLSSVVRMNGRTEVLHKTIVMPESMSAIKQHCHYPINVSQLYKLSIQRQNKGHKLPYGISCRWHTIGNTSQLSHIRLSGLAHRSLEIEILEEHVLKHDLSQ